MATKKKVDPAKRPTPPRFAASGVTKKARDLARFGLKRPFGRFAIDANALAAEV